MVPPVAPMVRIPVNGVEKGQWHAKQALDLGCYGIVWPHISTVEEAYNAVAACRYPRLKDKPLYEPQGIRGDGPTTATRYWGLTQQEYYTEGRCLAARQARRDLRDPADRGHARCGEPRRHAQERARHRLHPDRRGRPLQELGYPRQYEHKEVLAWMKRIVDTCKKHNVVVGHPHVEAGNCERIVSEGYRFLMCAPVRSFNHLDKARGAAGRNLGRAARCGPHGEEPPEGRAPRTMAASRDLPPSFETLASLAPQDEGGA